MTVIDSSAVFIRACLSCFFVCNPFGLKLLSGVFVWEYVDDVFLSLRYERCASRVPTAEFNIWAPKCEHARREVEKRPWQVSTLFISFWFSPEVASPEHGWGGRGHLSDVPLNGLRRGDNGDISLSAAYGTHMLKGRKVMGYSRNKREKWMREQSWCNDDRKVVTEHRG